MFCIHYSHCIVTASGCNKYSQTTVRNVTHPTAVKNTAETFAVYK